MAFFTYASPILPSKTSSLINYFQESLKMKQEDPSKEEISQDFHRLIGLKSWRAWVSSFKGKDYLIHCLEGEGLTNIILRLQYFIILKVPAATELYNVYRNCLGEDYIIKDHFPVVELKMSLAPNISSIKDSHVKSVMLPIQGSKIAIFDETLKHIESQIQFPKNLSKIEIFHQTHMKKNHFILIQATGNKDLSWEDINLGLSSSEYQSIFEMSELPFPMTFDEYSDKVAIRC